MNNEFDVAIVGMSGRFPGARNVDELWQNLAAGVESIARLTDQEILDAGVPASHLSNPNYVKAAPILDEPGHFDAGFFGFSPMEAKTMDPQHRILLELAHEALEHAGYDPDRHQGRIGVFTGAALNTYFTNVGLNSRLAEEYIPTLIGNDKDFLSTRISYKLNLRGPSITVQTACSTSMVAVHLARQSLLSEETDMALAGAISVRVPHRAGYFYDGGGVVSPDGHVRAFDAGANGTVFGSGGGILVLKRLANALADGDTIHAVIKGSAVNNDGSEKAGYTAPSVNSQADVVVEALANAGVEADSISYVEAHGSGTPVGDPIEIRALTKAFRSFTPRSSYCAIGSVKTNVGHLDAAAAVTGIIKTVLALKHRQLPPSLHFNEANPEIDFSTTPFYVNTRLREWTSDGPRRAGVMSTGMGGTNAHIVLEEAPEPGVSAPGRPPHLLILSAHTATALDQATDRLREFLNRHDSVHMSDVAHTLRLGRKAFAHRKCLVCADREDAITALEQQDSKRVLYNWTDNSRRPVVFLLPGIGDHYVGMAHELYETWAVFKQEVDRCAQILAPHLGIDIRHIIYPKSHSWKSTGHSKGIDLKKMLGRHTDVPDEARTLNTTLFAQPALFTIEYAMTRLWQSMGITPDAIVGHSMGEYVAACVAGVLSLDDALRLIATRAKLVNELPQGAMLAVTLAEHELLSLLPEGLSISLINGPHLCVVAGSVTAVAEFERTLNARGVICRPVQNGHAFHSRMLDPIVKAFQAEVSNVRLNAPRLPYISNVTGTWITPGEATDPAYWAKHTNHTARFSHALHHMWQLENPILLEAGPGRTLGVLAMQHPDRQNAGRPVAVPSIRHHYDSQSDVDFLWHSVGTLWLSGADIKWEHLHTADRPLRVPLPTYPFEKTDYWLQPVRVSDDAPHTQLSVHKNPDTSRWFYVPSWTRLLAAPVGTDDLRASADKDRAWLVYADDCGIASALIARLTSAGHDVTTVTPGKGFQQLDPRSFTIDPANPRHHDSLIRSLQAGRSLPAHIVHAWSVTQPCSARPARDDFAQAQHLGFYSLIFLAKALATHNVGHEINLFVLSNHVQDVYGTETLGPEKATLLGPCMVIRQEYPNIRTKSIDLDLSGQAGTLEAVADLVLGECVASDASLCVAYRNAQRWVQTYEPVALDTGPRHSSFREGGVYLITGGLGAIGIAVSEYLARHYEARLVLVGRSQAPDRDTLERLRALGADVVYVSADVADIDGMRGAVGHAYQRFGALHGVIHAAGIVGDNGLQEINDCDSDNCDRHFHAKAHGLLVLEEVLDDKDLDFCVLVSSLTSVLGGIGHAAYAASNVYMDSFARKHNRSHRVPWLSVNFDLWRFHNRTTTVSGLGRTVDALGHTAAEATSAMEAVLAARNASQLLVSTGALAARITQWITLESLDAGRTTAVASRTPSTPSQRSGARPSVDAPRDDTEHRIARIWQDALGIEAVGINDSFSQLGGHSLLAIRIVSELRKVFQTNLPVRALFDAPTVAELSGYVRKHLLAEIEALSDEEARQLVSERLTL